MGLHSIQFPIPLCLQTAAAQLCPVSVSHRVSFLAFQVEKIEQRCLELFGRDYCYSIIQNPNGELCSNYPRQIVFLEYESAEDDKHMYVTKNVLGI